MYIFIIIICGVFFLSLSVSLFPSLDRGIGAVLFVQRKIPLISSPPPPPPSPLSPPPSPPVLTPILAVPLLPSSCSPYSLVRGGSGIEAKSTAVSNSRRRTGKCWVICFAACRLRRRQSTLTGAHVSALS